MAEMQARRETIAAHRVHRAIGLDLNLILKSVCISTHLCIPVISCHHNLFSAFFQYFSRGKVPYFWVIVCLVSIFISCEVLHCGSFAYPLIATYVSLDTATAFRLHRKSVEASWKTLRTDKGVEARTGPARIL